MAGKVKIRIRDDYEGHHHGGEEIPPGTVIEVWERQAAWLMKIGAAEPVPKKKAQPPKDEGAEVEPAEDEA